MEGVLISMDKIELINKINKIKEQKNAVIVAHTYQRDEVQEIADMVGDSFKLSRYCASTDADMVVFCGVFYTESVKILSPEKLYYLQKEMQVVQWQIW